MSNYLVTGAAGFIAARVIDLLLQDGHTVYGVDNLNPAYDVRMKEYRLARLKERAGFTFEQMDVSRRDEVAALDDRAGKLDAVINLAARAGVRASVEDPWVFMETNATGTLNLLELCRRKDVPKFVLASTSSIYAKGQPMPYREDADTSHPLQPYAASKKSAEVMAYTYHFLHGIDVSIFRYFTVYGPAGRPDMFMFRAAKWIAEGEPVRLNGDGTATRGFTYLDDIARGTILGLRPVGYEIMNLGGHEEISMNDLIAMLEGLLGRKAKVEHYPFPKADAMANLADVSKAGRLLGWEPQVTLSQGVARLVDWYLAERAWASQLKTD
jgi:nucleoside-diphosphate-sugar epimerase